MPPIRLAPRLLRVFPQARTHPAWLTGASCRLNHSLVRTGRGRVPALAAGAVLVAFLGGAGALQALSGGIRTHALGPAVTAASLVALGGLIGWHRPHQPLAPLLVVNGLGFSLGTLAASGLDYAAVHPLPTVVGQLCFAVVASTRTLIAAWVLFILWFPDGSFVSPRWRRFFAFATALCTLVAVAVWLVGPSDRVFDFYGPTAVPAGVAGPWAGTAPALGPLSDLLLLLPLAAFGSLAQRYRRGNVVLRQQVRWLLVAVLVEVLSQILGAVLVATSAGALVNVGVALSIASQPLPAAATAVAILRHRLWDIDLVVSRALIYGALWAMLSGVLLLPALATGVIVGGSGALTAVALALGVTVLFQPVSRRLERLAQRVVFRHRERPYIALTDLWGKLRVIDLPGFGPLVTDAVCTHLGVSSAAIWSYRPHEKGGLLHPLAPATGPAHPVSPHLATLLRETDPALDAAPPAPLAPLWDEPPAAVIPLVAADRLVGVLACGPRRGDRLRPADIELLELLAREAALRLRNLLLEDQLRARLAELQHQASELADSRQRLVTAQDAERRRIERNLHDGVQQHLVSLAVRLQRLASPGAPAALAELAAEAEQAVFSLQELGRGIYPSVLSDQGLHAALRSQATRMPQPVHLEIDDALLGHRPDRNTEAALYFVALEALTNAHKHAPDASISVWLRAEQDRLCLHITDTGPGFSKPAGQGTGLQNMHDRMAALGGSLAITSEAGQGTRVTAAVPWTSAPAPPAEPSPAHPRKGRRTAMAQPVDPDSRR